VAIQSFADPGVETFFIGGSAPKRVGWSGITKVVLRKLDLLEYALQLDDLRSPPGNRLEALRGNLAGFYSIRVNDQWRVIFRWTDAGPTEVDVVDYH
jgi:proteic killer suppression protein